MEILICMNAIIIMWQDNFSTLLNSVQNIDLKEFVCEGIEHGIADNEIATVSVSDDLDNLNAGAHIGISVHLSLLLTCTSMLTYGHMQS